MKLNLDLQPEELRRSIVSYRTLVLSNGLKDSTSTQEKGPMNLGRKRRLLLSSRGPRRVAAGERGAEIVEFAVVLTALLMLLIGIIWIGRAYNIYQTITRAAREGARFALAPSCATCGNTFPTDTEVQGVINGALSAAALDPTKANPAIQIQRNQTLDPNDAPGYQFSGVVVSFGYPVYLPIPFTRPVTMTVSTRVQMRQEF
jgi:Flp pilus assembly protein TadG